MRHKAPRSQTPNRWVFSNRLNCPRLSHCRRWTGSVLHRCGPAAAKHRSPKLLHVIFVTVFRTPSSVVTGSRLRWYLSLNVWKRPNRATERHRTRSRRQRGQRASPLSWRPRRACAVGCAVCTCTDRPHTLIEPFTLFVALFVNT